MSNPPYIAAARQRYSVLRRRAVQAQLQAEAEAEANPPRRSRRPSEVPDRKSDNAEEA